MASLFDHLVDVGEHHGHNSFSTALPNIEPLLLIKMLLHRCYCYQTHLFNFSDTRLKASDNVSTGSTD
jgi:hypothetical protein